MVRSCRLQLSRSSTAITDFTTFGIPTTSHPVSGANRISVFPGNCEHHCTGARLSIIPICISKTMLGLSLALAVPGIMITARIAVILFI